MRKTMVKYNLVAERVKTYESVGRLNATHQVKDALERMFRMSEQAEEIFVMVCLDSMKQIIAGFEVSRGSLDSTAVSTREVFKRAITANAHTIILGHNHPSGSLKPSMGDRQVTNTLVKAGELLGIQVIDHVITGEDDRYFSFEEEGMI